MRRYLLWSTLCCIMSVTTACGGCDEPEPGDNNTMMNENAKPVARIEAPDTAIVDNEVSASGAGSTDADGDELSYTWSLDAPTGSSAALSATDTQEVTFTPDVPGEYTLSLTVNDGTEESDVVTQIVTVGSVVAPNQAPVANAGSDATVALGERVTLDGGASSDPDGDDLTYSWEITTNAGDGDQMISGEDAAQFSFTPSAAGDYVVTLTVSDGQDSSSDTVTVSVSDGAVNTAPVADAGEDANVVVGQEFTFDGSASIDLEDNANGAALIYSWEITTDPSNGVDMLVDPGTASPRLTPSVEGDYVVTLTVTDSGGESSSDSMTLSVGAIGANSDPVADAGTAQTVDVGDLVMLDGSGSTDVEDDAAGTPLTYAWTFVMDPSAGADVLSGADTATPGFTPSVAGDYILSLTVTDSEGATDSAEVTITVQPDVMNVAPVASAGPDQSVMTGATVTLDGSGSTDVEDDAAGTALTYAWTFTTDPSNGADALTGADTAAPTFTPSVEGTYVLTLTVTDSGGEVSTDTVSIIVQDVVVDQPPVAEAGPDQTVTEGDLVMLDGSGSTDIEDDAAGTALTYAWTFTTDPSNGADALTGANTAAPTFTPSVVGTYVLTLTVTDSNGATSTDTVTITAQSAVVDAPPTAVAGEDRYAVIGNTITLDGSGSTDVEDDAAGTALTYAWTLTMDPSAGMAVLNDLNTATPTIASSVPGMYEMTLTVTDSAGQSVTDLLVVNIIEAPQVIIGERIEGSGSNKAMEIYNYGTTTVDMAAVSVSVLSGINTDSTRVFNQAGTLAANEVFVLCHSGRDTNIVTATCDGETGTALNYNGDDVSVLYVDQDGVSGYDAAGNDYVLDVWGQIGTAPATTIYAEKGYNRCDFTPFDGQSPFVYTSYYTENPVQNDFSDLGTPPVAGCGAVVNLPPTADAGADQLVFVGDTVMLDGSGSTDPEDDAAGTALTYAWSLTTDPSNGVDMLMNANTAMPSIALSVAGTYRFTLTVTDSAGDMDSDIIEVIVRSAVVGNVPPLFISEIAEGSGTGNKIVEFFNGSDTDIDLTDIHAVTLANGAASSPGSLNLVGTLAAGDVLIVCNMAFDPAAFPLVPACDYSSNTVANFNGDDTTLIYIEDGTSLGFNPAEDTVIDAFGQIGVRPAGNPYADGTYERCDFTRYDGIAPFTAGRYAAPRPQNDFSGIGIAPPVVNGMPVSTCPNSVP